MSDDNDDAMPNSGAASDLQGLARDYVDLWESQIKMMSEDPALAQTLAKTMELMNAGAAGVAGMMDAAARQGADDDGSDSWPGDASQSGSVNNRAQAAGSASGNTEHDVRELARRLERIEDRLDRLEGLLAPSGKSPGGGTDRD